MCLNILVFDYQIRTFFPVGYICVNSKRDEAYAKALTIFENKVESTCVGGNWQRECVVEVHSDFEAGLIKGIMRAYK